ncbi:MAG: glycosyltransferase [Legionellaceae bacterium]|nr:glycosyltransferase [Legionellaceae bacterium]
MLGFRAILTRQRMRTQTKPSDEASIDEPPVVLILSNMYPRESHPSGGIFVHEQVKALRKQGIDARVLTGEPSGPRSFYQDYRRWMRDNICDWELVDGVPVIKFPYLAGLSFRSFQVDADTYAFGALQCIARIKSTFKFQIIHAHTSYLDGTAARKISKKYHIPFVITEHMGPFKLLTNTFLRKRKTQLAINASQKLIAVSHTLLRDICSEVRVKQPSNTCVLPNLVNTKLFQVAPQTCDISDARIRMLWVGHFVEVKRVDRLLEALAIAIKTEPRLYLKLLGNGALQDDFVRMVDRLSLEEHVEFVGWSNQEGLVKHYQTSDFLVVSSETETFSVVTIEAMSCGLPILSTNCGGPSEIVNLASLGLVVEQSTQALAQGMLDMASGGDKSNNFNKFNKIDIRKIAEQRYASHVVASNIINIYQSVMF